MMIRKSGGIIAAVVTGSLAFLMSCTMMENSKEARKADWKEVEVSINQVPEAVKTAILREAAGKQIEEIERTGSGKRAIYEAEFNDNGKEIEIKVSAHGEVISRESEEADD